MQRIALCAALAFLWTGTLPALADDTPTVAVTGIVVPAALAPADRYFGRLEMSVLGIRNGVRDLSLRIDAADPADNDRLGNYYRKLTFVEDALLDLKQKFPNDTWIPALGLDLAKAYMKLHVADASVRANDTLDWLIAEYPETNAALFARNVRADRLVQTSDDVPIEPVASP